MDVSIFLPNELWLQVFRYLSISDLKALRISAEPFNSLASSLLFTKAYIAARRGVLDTFTKLTTHPVFRHYVKEVVFDSSFINPATVTEHANDVNGPALACLFQEQEAIQVSELQTHLENAFKCLSNVKKVSYAELSRVSCLPGDYPVLGCDYMDGPLILQLESDLGSDEIRPCCLTAERNAGCPRHDDNFQYRSKYGGLGLLLQVLSDYASTTMIELSLGNRAHSCSDGGVPYWFLSNTEISPLYSSTDIFYNLRKLDLSLSFLHKYDPLTSITTQQHHIRPGDLAKLLGLTENLEELKLTGCIDSTWKMSITKILGANTWTRLRVLYLNQFEASAQELEDSLQRHTHSLENVTLDWFTLTSGSWLDFGSIVPAIAPKLEFILGSVMDRKRSGKIDSLLPLSWRDLDVSGPRNGRYTKLMKEYDDHEDEDWGRLKDLEYSSDDSSSETDEPRRKRRC